MNGRDPADAYWDAFARTVQPPADARARNLEAIRSRLADTDEPERRSRPWGAGRILAAAAALAAVAVLLLGVSVSLWHAVEARAVSRPSQAPATAPTPAPQPAVFPRSPVPPAVETATTAEAPPDDPPRVFPKPSRSATTSEHDVTHQSTLDRLRAEVDLMTRARAAFEAKRFDVLLTLCREHAHRFPDGGLTEERRAWVAVAACRLRRADARAHARDFLAAYPASAHVTAVRDACAIEVTDSEASAD